MTKKSLKSLIIISLVIAFIVGVGFLGHLVVNKYYSKPLQPLEPPPPSYQIESLQAYSLIVFSFEDGDMLPIVKPISQARKGEITFVLDENGTLYEIRENWNYIAYYPKKTSEDLFPKKEKKDKEEIY